MEIENDTNSIDNEEDHECKNSYSKSLLYAVKKNKIKLSLLLIENNADVNIKDINENSPLLYCCINNNIELCKVLLDNGANNVNNRFGISPILISIEHNYIDIFNLLIEKINDINMIINNYGSTILHLAAEYNNLEISTILINRGADVNVKDIYEDTALLYEISLEFTTLLINNGAEINVKNDDGVTPLHRASYNGLLDVVSVLIENGADIDSKDNVGDTPFIDSCIHNYIEISLLLIKHGADIYCKNIFGNTGLDDYCKYSTLSNEKIYEQVNILKDEYKREWNWRRRKEFVYFLVQNKSINNIDKCKDNNIYHQTNSIFEKILFIKELYMIIVSYI